jgi:hypothetical protein
VERVTFTHNRYQQDLQMDKRKRWVREVLQEKNR